MQEEGLPNEGTQFLLLHKQAHDQSGFAESLHVYINRARLTACEVGEISREISHSKIVHQPPLVEEPCLSLMGVFWRAYGIYL